MKTLLFHILIFTFFITNLFAQAENEFVVIEEIEIVGNKKTKDRIILRELNISVGDTIKTQEAEEILLQNRNQVYNLGLFNTVEIETDKNPNGTVDVVVYVTERWYWLVFPIFELADRNFNVWWRDFDRDIRRTKYGFIATKNNVGGRNETFVLNFKWGYNRKFIFSYKFPFIDKRKIWGLNLETYYFADREIAYTSIDNEAIFYTHNSFANNRFGAGFQLNRRADIRNTHSIRTFYYRNTIVDTLAQLNPMYFNNGKTKQQFFQLRYQYEFDGRNIRAYPTEGWYFRARANKQGLGFFNDVNRFYVEANVSKYSKIGKSQFVGTNLKVHHSFGKVAPYNTSIRLGFLEHFARGYEYYVIDNQSYVLTRNFIKQRLLDVDFKGFSKVNEQFSSIPIQMYLKFYNELAFSSDRFFDDNNALNNQFLAGYGVGLDIVTFYDNIFSLEYSYNRLRESSFIVHINLTWDFN